MLSTALADAAEDELRWTTDPRYGQIERVRADSYQQPLRHSHRNMLGGCAGRDVNHQVSYYHSGGFDKDCPWECGGKYLRAEYDKLARPLAAGGLYQGRQSDCCKNGKVDTEYMRLVLDKLERPPPIIRVSPSFDSFLL
jgi:hypothetical protein